MKKAYILCIIVSVLVSWPQFIFADSFSFSLNTGNQSDQKSPAVSESNGNGPPAHAPAWGYRSKHHYRYYPSASVYYEASSGLYFYLSGANWQASASLPDALKVKLGSYVSLDLDTDKPYIYNDQHRKQYPPGQTKNQSGKMKKNHSKEQK